jgi:hypothetical protein
MMENSYEAGICCLNELIMAGGNTNDGAPSWSVSTNRNIWGSALYDLNA